MRRQLSEIYEVSRVVCTIRGALHLLIRVWERRNGPEHAVGRPGRGSVYLGSGVAIAFGTFSGSLNNDIVRRAFCRLLAEIFSPFRECAIVSGCVLFSLGVAQSRRHSSQCVFFSMNLDEGDDYK
jgi:hypothetical protein